MEDIHEHIAKIKTLELKAKGLTKHLFSGEYQSAFKGRGMSFSEVRSYQIGDEIRTIDWNVTARYQEPYVKVFQEERELTLMFIVDVSGSQNYGSHLKTKKDIAIELCALLGFSALENKDKIGLLLVSDQVELYLAPNKGKKHLLHLLSKMMTTSPKSQHTKIDEGLKYFHAVAKKRCITFIISDFKDEHEFIEGLRYTGKKHDTIAIDLSDVMEAKMPNLGWLALENAESGTQTWIDTNHTQTRDHFEKVHQHAKEDLKHQFAKMGIDYIPIQTNEDYVRPLISFFKRRG